MNITYELFATDEAVLCARFTVAAEQGGKSVEVVKTLSELEELYGASNETDERTLAGKAALRELRIADANDPRHTPQCG